MKTSTKIKSFLLPAVTLTVLTACGGGGTDMNSPEYQAYAQRHAVMEELRDAILPLNQMERDEIPVDEAVFLESARALAAGSENVLNGWDVETIVAESRATPEIWANMDDFTAKGQELQAAAAALLTATEAGGFEAGRPLVAAARNTCGGCHRPYRGPEPE